MTIQIPPCRDTTAESAAPVHQQSSRAGAVVLSGRGVFWICYALIVFWGLWWLANFITEKIGPWALVGKYGFGL